MLSVESGLWVFVLNPQLLLLGQPTPNNPGQKQFHVPSSPLSIPLSPRSWLSILFHYLVSSLMILKWSFNLKQKPEKSDLSKYFVQYFPREGWFKLPSLKDQKSKPRTHPFPCSKNKTFLVRDNEHTVKCIKSSNLNCTPRCIFIHVCTHIAIIQIKIQSVSDPLQKISSWPFSVSSQLPGVTTTIH